MDPNDTFKKLFEESKNFYHGVGSVYCPALKSDIFFNAEGFQHLRYKNSRSGRSKQERRNKLAYLKEAVEVLKISTTYQEYREKMCQIGTADSKGFRTMTNVAFYAFWAVLEKGKTKIRIRVIVRKTINSGKYIFWSVMPDWKEKVVHGQTIRYFASNTIEEE